MEFHINIQRESDVPIYRQIIEQIITMIKNGQLKAGDKLPPERELSARTGIARGTINKAYEILERDKIIEVIQGRGSFISLKQEVLGKDRKEAAIRLIDETLSKLEDLHFSYREISTLIKIRISEREKRQVRVKVAAVDCNPEALSIFENQLSYISNIVFSRFLLDDMNQYTDVESILREYDIIVTTSTHYSELCGILKGIKDRVFQAAVSPSQQTVIDIATIPVDAQVGILCKSQQFMNIIKNRLRNFEIKNVDGMLEKEGADYEKFICSKDVLIIPPDFEQQKHGDIFKWIEQFIQNGGKVISFEYQLERGSLIYLEGEISNILNGKA